MIKKPPKGSTTKNEKSSAPRLILNYSKESPQIVQCVQKCWPILKQDKDLTSIIGDRPLISYRRASSIQDRVIHSHFQDNRSKKTNWLEKQRIGFHKCNKCKACKIAVNKQEIRDPTGRKIQITHSITCTTQFVVYVIQCCCGQMYIGSTVCTLKKRILEHIRAIKNKDLNYATANHILACQKGDWHCMTFFGLDSVPQHERMGDSTKKLRQLESKYIIRLRTKSPFGMNNDEEYYVHL